MKRKIQALIGLLIGAVMVWLLFRDTNWSEVGTAFQNIHWGWLAVSQIPLWMTFPTRVQRWTYIVRVDRPAKFRHLFSATQIGFLANFTLPARAGEAIRALVLSRLTGIPFVKAFAMSGLDRVTDIFGLITVMLISIAAFRPSEDVVIPAKTFGTPNPIVFTETQYTAGAIGAGIVLFVAVGAFVMLYVNRNIILRISDAALGFVSQRIAGQVHQMIDHFADGLHIFKSPAEMAKALAFALFTWAWSVMFMFCIVHAFFDEVPWYLPFVMQSLIAAFISVPGAPGFVGQFHIPIVITIVMLMPEVNVDHAKAAAILIHLLQLPPVGGLGVWCLLRENVKLFELSREAEEAEEHVVEEGEESGQ